MTPTTPYRALQDRRKRRRASFARCMYMSTFDADAALVQMVRELLASDFLTLQPVP